MIFFIKKIFSACSRLFDAWHTLCGYIYIALSPTVTVAQGCSFGKSIKFKATDNGVIKIGRCVNISNNVQIIACGGSITIENGVFIGIGTVIVSRESITIGKNSLIAEYVVIRDQDHRTDTKPLAASGFHTNPIHIGRDVWIGCKATILRGTTIGRGCVIGAHSLVNTILPDNMLAVGTPARIIKPVRHS